MPEADDRNKKRRSYANKNEKKKKSQSGDKRQSSPKKKTSAPVPDQFLSKDFLEKAGFEDQDAHKLMNAIMDYNRKYVQDLYSSDDEDLSDEEYDEKPTKDSRRNVSDGKSREKPRDEEKSREKPRDYDEPGEKSRTKEPARHHHHQEERSKGKSKLEPPMERSKEKKPSTPEAFENNLQVEPLKDETKDEKEKLKNLIGKQVDGSGNVLDDNGKIIGKVQNDWSHLAGKFVNDDGAIVDDFGNIYGNIEPVGPEKKKGISFSNGQEDILVNVDATKSGISFSIHIPRPQ